MLSTIDYMAADEDEATLVSVPPYHIAGMATILSSVYSGRRIMYLPQFEPKEWVQVADQEGITHAMVVPTMLSRHPRCRRGGGSAACRRCIICPTAAAACRYPSSSGP